MNHGSHLSACLVRPLNAGFGKCVLILSHAGDHERDQAGLSPFDCLRWKSESASGGWAWFELARLYRCVVA